MTGSLKVIYLTDKKRTAGSDDISRRHSEIMARGRFGKITDRDLLELKQLFASKAKYEADSEFKKAWIAEDRHYFNPDEPNQKLLSQKI